MQHTQQPQHAKHSSQYFVWTDYSVEHHRSSCIFTLTDFPIIFFMSDYRRSLSFTSFFVYAKAITQVFPRWQNRESVGCSRIREKSLKKVENVHSQGRVGGKTAVEILQKEGRGHGSVWKAQTRSDEHRHNLWPQQPKAGESTGSGEPGETSLQPSLALAISRGKASWTTLSLSLAWSPEGNRVHVNRGKQGACFALPIPPQQSPATG